jgi:hypothetical protein
MHKTAYFWDAGQKAIAKLTQEVYLEEDAQNSLLLECETKSDRKINPGNIS